MVNRFILNEVSYFGPGARKELPGVVARLGFTKALVVTDKGLMKFGVAKMVLDVLDEANIPYAVYDDVKPNPTVTNVKMGVEALKAAQADFIVAIGGGSAMDTAKGIGIVSNNPEFADVVSLEGVADTKKKTVPIIALPTTAGTAAETTINYVIIDETKQKKMVCVDPNDIPCVAIVDAELMYSLPKSLTAATGMDAMTHAIEAYVSTAHCDYTDPLAIFAIRMIQGDLVDSYNGDMSKRDSMHNAQCLAGMAFSNALLGIVHSMAHKTGAAFADYGAHIIHGAANAMYLPKVIAFNAKDPEAKKRYGVIADEMKLGGASDDEKVKLLIEYLRGMNDALNIPHCIQHYGPDSYPAEQGFVPEDVFLQRLPEIAKNAIADACTGSNPRQPSQEEMEKLLKCCYYDTEVDF